MPEYPDSAMSGQHRRLEKQFKNAYFLVAALPLLLMLVFVLAGMLTARQQVEGLLNESIDALNHDAEKNLERLGEKLIVTKARDLARELAVYIRDRPDMTLEDLKADPGFADIGLQSVGETGYTIVTEALTYQLVLHPVTALNGSSMRQYETDIPSLYVLVERAIRGAEMSGYYDWVEPDGSTRRKFMASSPVPARVGDSTLNAVATIYVDEFSSPMLDMRQQADETRALYGRYVSQAWTTLAAVLVAIALLAILVVWYFGRRTTSWVIEPILELADVAGRYTAGQTGRLEVPSISSRHDEIGQLGRSLEAMSSRVNGLLDDMNARVSELSETKAALEDSQDQLRILFEQANTREQEYRSLLDTSADAIVTFDLDGRVTYVNRAFSELFGWEIAELEGGQLDYLPEDETEQALGYIRGASQEGLASPAYEARRRTRDGRLVDVSVSISRFNDHEDKPAGMLAVIRDISETKRLQQQLHHDERLRSLGNLAGGIAHDFNNILMVIQGCVTLIRSESDLACAREHLDLVEAQIESASSLTRQLLGYAGKGQYEIRVDNPNEVVRKAAAAVARTHKNTRLILHLEDNLANVKADFFQLEQVLMNLLLNATDAMPEGGGITVSSNNEERGGVPGVLICVHDTGPGIDPGTLSHIFEPFFTTKEIGRGTGLGLASARGIVEAHEGTLTAESTPGEGTDFYVWLPASDTTARPMANSGERAYSGQGRILCVDDEEMVLKVTSRMLELLGYDVMPVIDGGPAIKHFQEHADAIDLVLLDMVMPGVSSTDVFEAIREIKPGIPVLLVTGYSMEDRTDSILSHPGTDFLQKPFTIEALSGKVATALEAGTNTLNRSSA